MSFEGQKIFPGDAATARQVLALAHEYRGAAEWLLRVGRPGEPLSLAPFRLVGIHAIELYLNALLIEQGVQPAELRGFHHNLARRTERALEAGLVLRKRTAEHLVSLSDTREYLIARYSPETRASS